MRQDLGQRCRSLVIGVVAECKVPGLARLMPYGAGIWVPERQFAGSHNYLGRRITSAGGFQGNVDRAWVRIATSRGVGVERRSRARAEDRGRVNRPVVVQASARRRGSGLSRRRKYSVRGSPAVGGALVREPAEKALVVGDVLIQADRESVVGRGGGRFAQKGVLLRGELVAAVGGQRIQVLYRRREAGRVVLAPRP